MKTIEELFKEKEGYYTKMLETSQKYINLDKPVSLAGLRKKIDCNNSISNN